MVLLSFWFLLVFLPFFHLFTPCFFWKLKLGLFQTCLVWIFKSLKGYFEYNIGCDFLDPWPWLGVRVCPSIHWSILPSVVLSSSFLGIGLVVFLKLCMVLGPHLEMYITARFFQKNALLVKMTKNSQKRPKNGVLGLFRSISFVLKCCRMKVLMTL